MRATIATPQQPTIRREYATRTAHPALAERPDMRQPEQPVSGTGGERLQRLWHRLRLTVQEMNYATRRLLELQMRLS